MTLTIRWRLTLWYGAVLAVCLAAFGTAVYVLTSRSQLARIDFELSEELHELQHDVVTVQDRETLLSELRSEFGKHPAYEFEIAQSDGAVWFRSDRLGTQSLETVSATASESSEPRFLELSGLGRYRVQAQWVDSPHGRLSLRAAIPLDAVESAQRTLWRTLCLMGPLVLAAAMAGGYWLARRALSPVERITATAETITANRLDQRLDVPPVQDELSRLARTLNAMIDRLQRAFDDMRRFTADAAHELRTPITLLRTQLDVALRNDRSNDEYRNVLLSLREDVEHFGRLASQLLELSREDAGLDAAPFAPLRLDSVLMEAANERRPAAEQKSLSLRIDPLTECEVHGDADRLHRVFLNVLDNAIKFTPPRGQVRVSLRVASHADASGPCRATVTIQDTGCGIAPEHLPYIFDRFYQVDSSRNITTGTGLGLAICQAIVTAHQGSIRVNSVAGQETMVEVEFTTLT